jgi:hypothetical protein
MIVVSNFGELELGVACISNIIFTFNLSKGKFFLEIPKDPALSTGDRAKFQMQISFYSSV